MVSFAEKNSENAQRELRDSVTKSLYADHAEEMFVPPKKLKCCSQIGTAASARLCRQRFAVCCRDVACNVLLAPAGDVASYVSTTLFVVSIRHASIC
jgi:hypothetical protein